MYDQDEFDWRPKADLLAESSIKQCDDCCCMPKDECLKWGYTRQSTKGKNNQAPFCQFYKHKENMVSNSCPLCGSKR